MLAVGVDTETHSSLLSTEHHQQQEEKAVEKVSDVQSVVLDSGCDSSLSTLPEEELPQSKSYNGLAVVIDAKPSHPTNLIAETYMATPNSNGEPSQPQASSTTSGSSVDMTDMVPDSLPEMPFVDIPKRKGSRGLLDSASPLASTADSRKSDVLFTKRTSSLPTSEHVETLHFGPKLNPPPPTTTAFDTVATLTTSWTGLLSGMGFGKRLKETQVDPHTTQESQHNVAGNRDSVASMLQYISQQDYILEKLDDTSTKLTLARLERENQLLELNPKTILADSGSYRTATTTLQDLKSATSIVETESDSEFWNSLMTGYANLVHKIPHLLNSKIRAGIPYHLRPKIWMVMCNAQTDRIALLYPSLVREESPFERIILRDLPRTFPKVDFFKEADGPGQKMLFNVLKAYSIYDSEVGYCQGLSFVVGPLLMQNLTEVEAFSILVRLMEESPVKYNSLPRKECGGVCLTPRYNLRTLFTPHMKGLHLMIYQHTRLLAKILPRLYQHFQTHQIHATMYASQWFLTMFAYNFPFPMVFRIFDILFAEGADETILRFSIALLKKSQEKLLEQTEFEGILKYLKEDTIFMAYQDNVEDWVKDAMSLTEAISEANLELYKKEQENLSAEEELQNMRNLVQQLRNDSAKMVETLRELSLRNAILERDHASFQVFKKGAQLEAEGLRKELEQSKLLIDLLKTDKDMLVTELDSIKENSIKKESKTVEEMEELRLKIKDLEYMVEHLVGPPVSAAAE